MTESIKKSLFDQAMGHNTEELTDNNSADWLNTTRHSILLYGQPKIGKSFAYCSIIDDAVKNNKKVFVINTDAGLAETFKAYFGKNHKEIATKIKYFFCKTTREGIKAVQHVINEAKKDDWVIVDLMSDFWSMAQDEFLDATGMNPDQYIQLASRDPSKFGLYDANKWTYIKKLDNQITDILPKRGEYNILGVCGSTDIKAEKAITGIKTHEYDSIGERPTGQKRLPYNFDTIIYIGGRNKKFFKIFGKRGLQIKDEAIQYGNNFWETYLKTIEVTGDGRQQ